MDLIAQSRPRATRIAETEEDIALLRRHLQEIVEGAAFKGSHRSAQFLKHIVEQSIAGSLDSLKERAIGIELFGRSPSYDTGEDAIVRVTASDVRKRLLQHYGKYGSPSELRLGLPLGSYVPEVRWDCHHLGSIGDSVPASSPLAAAIPAAVPAAPEIVHWRSMPKWLVVAVMLAGLNLAVWGLFWRHSSSSGTEPVALLPWSALLRPTGATKVVTSDPNIEKIERLSGQRISLSDYANQKYIPDPGALSPEIVSFCRDILRGDLTPAVDTAVVAKIAALAQAGGASIDVEAAREIRLSQVYTDDNFVFLGSPVSNRWAGLFNDQLDFRFIRDNGLEIIRNVHPRAGENATYIPTARGYATGQTYATIGFLRNPGRTGQVLLLAGANAEGTTAAGELITSRPRLAAALQSCGIRPSGPTRYFQLLLGLNTMAGSPSDVRVLACHVLSGSSV
jgi:hypothetical protein